MIDGSSLKRYANNYGIELNETMLNKLDTYAGMLVDWNQRINLTSITDPGEITVKHFLDSLLLLSAIQVESGIRLIDVGTGAGFPAVPLKIAKPDINITLLDSLNKRLVFLRELCERLGLTAEIIHERAEDAGQKTDYREKYDVVTARAVARLYELCEYCLPFVKVGGVFAAYKGGDVEQELDEGRYAIGILGGKLADVKRFTLPDGSARTIVIIQKISQTSSQYPRQQARITKKPLKQ